MPESPGPGVSPDPPVTAATDLLGNLLDPKPQSIGIDDLFPPPAQRYLSDDAIEQLRLAALKGAVTLSPLTVMGIVCDLRNMAADLEPRPMPWRADR